MTCEAYKSSAFITTWQSDYGTFPPIAEPLSKKDCRSWQNKRDQ